MGDLKFSIDRVAKEPIALQISSVLRAAIREGRLAAGARLPSWRDLAVQLGVARGTVRLAYERLIDEQLVVASGAAGTHVAHLLMPAPSASDTFVECLEVRSDWSKPALAFQMGVPAQDAFPVEAWARIVARAARNSARAPLVYPNPQGEVALRIEIAACLALTRGFACIPSQIFVTNGHAGALSLVVRALELTGTTAWTEEPGYPVTRHLLGLLRVKTVPVPVDAEGLDVDKGIAELPTASLAVVTPGQQAPLGVTMSPIRRRKLLDWAERAESWIVEDDYLSELQVKRRAAPALSSLDRHGRVLHIGSFSKTISPSLRLGFLVVPADLVPRFSRSVDALSSAPGPLMQQAVAEFLVQGHYLRHLRRMKLIYASRRSALAQAFDATSLPHMPAGLALLLRLPAGVSDVEISGQALAEGMAPTPLSPWYALPHPSDMGLLLNVTNVAPEDAVAVSSRLHRLVARLTPAS